MSELHFEWDERKAAANLKKHGVSFEEARSVFHDERARLIDDPDHSEEEERFILLGLSATLKMLGCLPLLPKRQWRDPNYIGPQGNGQGNKILSHEGVPCVKNTISPNPERAPTPLS